MPARGREGLRDVAGGGSIVSGTAMRALRCVSSRQLARRPEPKQFQLWRERPKEIPPNPRVVYLRSGEWLGWDDFLGRAEGEVLARGVVSSATRERG